jgi:tRNA(fMet)-specific endonuclease VapC
MYLLDTDYLILLQRRSQPDFGKVAASMSQYAATDFYLSIPTVHEQILGANAYISRARNIAGVIKGYRMIEASLRDYQRFQVLPFDEAAADVFSELRNSVRVGTMDLRIASIALANGLTLLTRNTVDFSQVPHLAIEDWTRFTAS